MSIDLFGQLRSGHDLERAVADTLTLWAPTYLHEIERQYDLAENLLAPPRNVGIISDFEKWPEQTPPFIGVISPGLIAGSALKEGRGAYRAKWAIVCAAIVTAKDKQSTRILAELYATMIRGVILQRRDLGGIANGTEWVDESYDDLPVRKSRTLSAATVSFEIEMQDAVSQLHGPHQPEPPGDEGFPHTVEEVIIDINKEEIA